MCPALVLQLKLSQCMLCRDGFCVRGLYLNKTDFSMRQKAYRVRGMKYLRKMK